LTRAEEKPVGRAAHLPPTEEPGAGAHLPLRSGLPPFGSHREDPARPGDTHLLGNGARHAQDPPGGNDGAAMCRRLGLKDPLRHKAKPRAA